MNPVQHPNLIALSFAFDERERLKLRYPSVSFFWSNFSCLVLCLKKMCQTNRKTDLLTTWTTPKRSTFHFFEELVLPFEVISVCSFVKCSDVCLGSQMEVSQKLPQQIALAKYPTQVSAIFRVVNVTQFWCCSFVSPSPFLAGQLSNTYPEMWPGFPSQFSGCPPSTYGSSMQFW